MPLFYRDHQIGEHRLDFVVEGKIVVELKAVEALENVHFAIVRSYLKAPVLSDGLILNFSIHAVDGKASSSRARLRDTLIYTCKTFLLSCFPIQICLTDPQFQCSTSRSMVSGISFRRARG